MNQDSGDDCKVLGIPWNTAKDQGRNQVRNQVKAILDNTSPEI